VSAVVAVVDVASALDADPVATILEGVAHVADGSSGPGRRTM
jgi:hypothetical protein